MTAVIANHVENFFTADTDAPTAYDRMAARRDKKRSIAELQLSYRRFEELLVEFRHLDARADAAAGEHQVVTAAIQAELSAAEESIVGALADQMPVLPELEAARTACLARLREANEKLATEIAAIEKLKRQNQSSRDALGGDSARLQVAQWELAKEPLANPELLFERQVLESKKPWLEKWAAHLTDRVSKIEADIAAQKRGSENFARQFTGSTPDMRISAETSAYLEQARRIAGAAGGEAGECVARLGKLHELMIEE